MTANPKAPKADEDEEVQQGMGDDDRPADDQPKIDPPEGDE